MARKLTTLQKVVMTWAKLLGEKLMKMVKLIAALLRIKLANQKKRWRVVRNSRGPRSLKDQLEAFRWMAVMMNSRHQKVKVLMLME
jgi:biotin synthase-related radical SAM superfamily protein